MKVPRWDSAWLSGYLPHRRCVLAYQRHGHSTTATERLPFLLRTWSSFHSIHINGHLRSDRLSHQPWETQRPLERVGSASRSKKRHPFTHLVVCLTTGPKPLPKPALHIVRSRASSFKWEYPLLSLKSSSSFLCLLPRLPVTSISFLSFLQ